MNGKTLTTIIICCARFIPCAAQEIHTSYTSISPIVATEVKEAFDKRHEFSERVYMSNKLVSSIVNPSFTRLEYGSLITSEKWPAGTWGRGFYTTVIENQPENQPGIGLDSLWAKYGEDWYGIYQSNSNIQTRYLSSHPLIWDTGNRTIAYIHMHQSGINSSLNPLYLQRVKDGLAYLLEEQVINNLPGQDGGFPDWGQRVSQTNMASIQGNPEEQHSAIALRALAEGYAFLNGIGDHSMNDELWYALIRGANFFLDRESNIINNYQPVNARAFSAWALTGVYKVTRETKYLNFAIKIVNSFIVNEYQRPDGSWKSPTLSAPDSVNCNTQAQCDNYEWHDSRSGYHGIILKGLAELYSVVPDSHQPFKGNLRNSIINSINHIIDYNGTTPAPEITQAISDYNLAHPNAEMPHNSRVLADGRILNFHRNDGCFNALGTCASGDSAQFLLYYGPHYGANDMLQGLIYSKNFLLLSPGDVAKVDNLINGIVKAICNTGYTIKNTMPGEEMKALSIYLFNSFDSFHHIKLGLFDSQSKTFSIFENDTYFDPFLADQVPVSLNYEFSALGNFDDDEDQEIAFYNRTGASAGGQPCNGWVSIFDITTSGLVLMGGICTLNGNFDVMSAIDYDNDGIDEVALFDKQPRLLNIYENNSYSGVPIFSDITPVNLSYSLMSIGNFSGHSEPEVAFYNETGASAGGQPCDGWISVFNFVNGELTLTGGICTKNDGFESMVNFDYDLDGIDEIALYDRTLQQIKIFKNHSYDGIPLFVNVTSSSLQFDYVAAGDFDNDNKKELAFFSESGGSAGGNPCPGWVAVYDLDQSGFNWTGSICTNNGDFIDLYPVRLRNEFTSNSSGRLKTESFTMEVPKADSKENVILFPNPVDDKLYTVIDESEYGILSAAIYDVRGVRMLVPHSQENGGSSFDVSKLPSGVYYVRMSSGKMNFTKKFIKN